MPGTAPSCCVFIRWINHKTAINRDGESFAISYTQAGTNAGNLRADCIARYRIISGNIPSVIKHQQARLKSNEIKQLANIRRVCLKTP